MPLRLDDNYRGPRALHVRDHRKLGKHRTLIRPALSTVNWLIDHDQVTKVDFGKMVGGLESHSFTHRVTVKITKMRIRVVLVAKNCAQAIEVTARSDESARVIAEELQRRWMMLDAAND